ncbi:MAG: acyl-CoA dehydrogenase family protein [Acidimicrobiales bacterium]
MKLDTVIKLFSDDAAEVDRAESIPASHFDALAKRGLYGAFAPVDDGGLDLGLKEMADVVEELAAVCLASTFVWIQHFRLLAAVLDPAGPPGLRDLRAKVISGETKGGVALGGQLPGPAKLRAVPLADGWLLNGEAPWVSGWGVVDQLYVAARGPQGTVVSLLLPAVEQPGLLVTPHQLSALNASATVRLDFESVEIEGDQFIGVAPYDPLSEAPEGLRVNGSLALGVARRCCSLLGPSPLDDELTARRADLDHATSATMPIARARTCELAVRASHALAVFRGSSSVLDGGVAERTAREAALLLNFGSRPSIREALLKELGASERNERAMRTGSP